MNFNVEVFFMAWKSEFMVSGNVCRLFAVLTSGVAVAEELSHLRAPCQSLYFTLLWRVSSLFQL